VLCCSVAEEQQPIWRPFLVPQPCPGWEKSPGLACGEQWARGRAQASPPLQQWFMVIMNRNLSKTPRCRQTKSFLKPDVPAGGAAGGPAWSDHRPRAGDPRVPQRQWKVRLMPARLGAKHGPGHRATGLPLILGRSLGNTKAPDISLVVTSKGCSCRDKGSSSFQSVLFFLDCTTPVCLLQRGGGQNNTSPLFPSSLQTLRHQ